MTQSLWKDLFREIKNNKSRFLSIFFIVALGVAFLAGVRATEPDMMYSVDKYYDDKDFMDLRVISTLGLTDNDVLKISAVKNVEYAAGGKSLETYCHFIDNTSENAKEETKTIKVYEYLDGINEPEMVEGELPSAEDECIIDYQIADDYGVEIGDTITLVAAGDDDLSDSLVTDTYTVTGLCETPWYLTYDRGTGSIGNGNIDYFIIVPPVSFVTDVYTEIYVQVEGARELLSGSDEYEELVETVADRIELITESLGEERLIEVQTQAREEAYDSQDYIDAYNEAYEEAYAEAYDEAYNTAYDQVYQEAYDTALEEVKAKAYEEALATVKEEALEEAMETARQTAYDEALEEAKSEAYDTALETAKEEARQTAWDTLVAESYDEALETVRSEAYASGLTSVNDKVEEITAQIVAAYCDASNENLREILDTIDSMPTSVTEIMEIMSELSEEGQEALSEVDLSEITSAVDDLGLEDTVTVDMEDIQISLSDLADDVESSISEALDELYESDAYDTINDIQTEIDTDDIQFDIDLPEITLSDMDAIYLLIFNELRELVADQEISDVDEEELTAQITESISPTVEEYYAEYFNTQFESVYKTLFDLQYEDELYEQYWDEFSEQFDAVFTEQYQALFDEQFEQTFNDEYLELFNEEFDSTFESQYEPLIEYQFEKTFEEEYLDTFNDEFEKTFEEEYLDDFNEEFEKTFTEEYKDEFDETFAETFEEEYLDLFNEEFEEAFNEEFEKELQEELDEIDLPTWYIFGRGDSVATYIEYQQDAEGIGKIGEVFPVIFFLVAALVALTTMTRMVEEERSQIGTLKALGYSNLAVSGKYIIYTLLAAVFGSILGAAFGENVFPIIIMKAYGIMFTDIPKYYQPFQWDIAILAALAAIGCILIATLGACMKSTSSKPAALMRPPAPKAGKRIFLEHITILWKHLSFTAKASMRNLFRYKKRLFMTVFGIGGCMALLLVGFGLRDSILTIAKYQYRAIFTYDVSVDINADADDGDKRDLEDTLETYEGITDYLEIHTETVDAIYGDNTKNLSLYVPSSTENFGDYVVLADRKTGEAYSFPTEGIAISEKSADKLGVNVGDTITLRDADNNETSVTIECIFENYVNHYIFMSRELYEELFGDEFSCNAIFMLNDSRDEEFQDDLSHTLMDLTAVSGVTLVSSLDESLENMLSSLDVVIWVLIISAGALAFIVLFNLNNINITERRRELATIKVLGFYDGEVAAYVYRDNIWLTLFGCIAGVFIGKWLHSFIITTVEVEVMMFGRDISLSSYGLSILLTTAFSVFVNFIMYFQLKKINMVESLKSVE